MATFRIEIDSNGEPQLVEEENGTFETPSEGVLQLIEARPGKKYSGLQLSGDRAA